MTDTSTILIVDDNAINRMALEGLLLSGGYQIEMAASGPEALEKASQFQPDLVLLDVMMPGMDGFEVCRRLRAMPDLADLPVVMVTALSDEDSRLQGLQSGADDIISKPFSSAELRARVHTITRLNRYRRLALERQQRQHAEAHTQLQLQRLSVLHDIDMQITSRLDRSTVLSSLVQQLHQRLDLDAVAVLLLDPASSQIEHAASVGFQSDMVTYSSVAIGEALVGAALQQREPVFVSNLSHWHNSHYTVRMNRTGPALPAALVQRILASHTVATMKTEGFASCYAVPLIAREQARGVLQIFHRQPLAPNADWLDFLETMARQAAITLENAELFETLQQSYDATLEGWVRALDLRDKETEGHSQRVTDMTVQLGRAAGLSDDELVHVRRGALLHDIGKLGIPDSILLKPGKLSAEEWAIMKTHPTLAYNWLSHIPYLRPALDIPHYHHEKWDGSGYPCGLLSTQIPLAARMFAVIDVWDALSSDRPYRAAWPHDKVVAYLQDNAGTHFDPQMVTLFLEIQRSTPLETCYEPSKHYSYR